MTITKACLQQGTKMANIATIRNMFRQRTKTMCLLVPEEIGRHLSGAQCGTASPLSFSAGCHTKRERGWPDDYLPLPQPPEARLSCQHPH